MLIKKTKQIAVFLLLSSVFLNLNAQEITCKLKGTVNGRDTKELLLVKAIDDPRFNGISIPIINNQFEFNLNAPHLEEYRLIFKEELERGSFRPIAFFPDTSVIEFSLYPRRDFSQTTIVGGQLNKTKQLYESDQRAIMMRWMGPIRAKGDSLRQIGQYDSAEKKDFMAQLRQAETQEERVKLYAIMNEFRNDAKGYTPEAWLLKCQSDSINRVMTLRQIDYVKNNQDIYSYSLFLKIVDQYEMYVQASEHQVIESIYASYAKQYPSHPYTTKLGEVLNALKSLQIGSKYIDFTASTIDGEIKTLSQEIDGKFALINLWSTWCGPCRVTGKSMIPIYEKYKDKGFTVIGVAGVQKDTAEYRIAVEKDKYPWLNLMELDNQNGIWNKYNIAYSGGSTWLVDADGKILAIHPSAAEVDEILSELLK